MSKNKIDFSKIIQLRSNFFNRESWLKVRKKKSDHKCKNCGLHLSEEKEEKLTAIRLLGEAPKVVCSSCTTKIVDYGIIDLNIEIKKKKESREKIIEEIIKLNPWYKNEKGSNRYRTKYLVGVEVEKLNAILEVEIKKVNDAQILKEAIERDFVETPTEEYLIKDFNLFEDKDLKHELEIESYFMENGSEWVGGGIGEYQDEARILMKIGARFYHVDIKAEFIGGSKDYGERRYHFEGMEWVKWAEIEKPKPREKKKYAFNAILSDIQFKELEKRFKNLDLEYLVIREME